VFGSRGLAANGIPYPLFVVSGLVPWFYFANATAGASGSIVGNAQLISKVYFPRLAIPLAAVLANLVDFSIGLALVLILMVVFGTPLTASLLALPLLILLIVLAALGVSVTGRAGRAVPRRATPCPSCCRSGFRHASDLRQRRRARSAFQPLLSSNPMTGIIEARAGRCWGRPPPLAALAIPPAWWSASGTGLLYFRRMERSFADVI
jgi:lipopolysaccharide transport system permease protein